MAKKPGKYDAVMKKLDRIVHANKPDYQVEVEAEKTRIRADLARNASEDQRAVALAHSYAIARAEKDVIEAQLYNANRRIEALTQLLVESQEQRQQGWGAYGAAENTIVLPSGDRARTQSEIYTNITSQDDVREYAKKDGLERSLMLPWPKVNSLNKDRIYEGQPPIPGTKVYVKTKVVFTPAKSVEEETDTAEFL